MRWKVLAVYRSAWMRCVLGCCLVAGFVGCSVSDEPEMVERPECGDKVPDFTPESECIGWLGRCAKCEMNDVYCGD